MQPDNNKKQFTPVMDVQRPPNFGSTQIQKPAGISSSDSLSRPATMEYTRPRPGDPSAPSFTPEPTTTQFTAPVKQKKSKKGLVIAVFTILLLGLSAGGGGYYYLVISKKDQPALVKAPQPEPESTNTQSNKVEATPSGIDKANEQIDQQLNSVDDTKDFTNNDVSDSGLGL